MGDSDDEYDRKRRDKFRGERPESYSREGRRDDRRRDEWVDREWSSRPRARPDYREYRGGGGGGGRERYSPARSQDMAPPMKRMRGDWDDRGPRYGGHPDYYSGGGGGGGGGSAWGPDHYPPPHHGGGGGGGGNHHYGNHGNASSREVPGNFSNSNVETQPPMMTFKAFLGTQEDSITDEEAIKRYNEYKLEFRRQQLNEFFVAHKDEECTQPSTPYASSTDHLGIYFFARYFNEQKYIKPRVSRIVEDLCRVSVARNITEYIFASWARKAQTRSFMPRSKPAITFIFEPH